MADLGAKLPDGVMMEILSRVPPESLLQFKCVSKSWYARINDPRFFCSLRNDQNVLLKRNVTNKETRKYETRFYFLKYPIDDDSSVEFEVENVHFPSFVEPCRWSIHGHSHGFVCLVPDGETIYLHNPVTRELRKLPPSILLIPRPEGSYDFDRVQSLPGGVGFGCDPQSKNLKVVRIVGFVPPGTDWYDYDLERTYLPARAEVYDLKKDEWREINTPIPMRVNVWWYRPSFQLYYQGFYYWLPKAQESACAEIILWFDMSQEVFGEIPLPEGFQKLGMCISIHVLNGSIVLLRRWDGETHWDVWEMVKLGDGVVSWSKLFTIGPFGREIDTTFGFDCATNTTLSFLGSNKLLMDTYDGQLILYDIKTQHSRHLPLLLDEDEENNPGDLQAIVFVKTLLSVYGRH